MEISRKKKKPLKQELFLVPLTRLELVRSCPQRILSPVCLPIPPQRLIFDTSSMIHEIPSEVKEKNHEIEKSLLSLRDSRLLVSFPGNGIPFHANTAETVYYSIRKLANYSAFSSSRSTSPAETSTAVQRTNTFCPIL